MSREDIDSTIKFAYEENLFIIADEVKQLYCFILNFYRRFYTPMRHKSLHFRCINIMFMTRASFTLSKK